MSIWANSGIPPVSGLKNQSMYYVYADTSTSVKFVENKFELELVSPNFVNLNSTGSGSHH